MARMISENEKRERRESARRQRLIQQAAAKGCTDPAVVVDALLLGKDLCRIAKVLGADNFNSLIKQQLVTAVKAAGPALPVELSTRILSHYDK